MKGASASFNLGLAARIFLVEKGVEEIGRKKRKREEERKKDAGATCDIPLSRNASSSQYVNFMLVK